MYEVSNVSEDSGHLLRHVRPYLSDGGGVAGGAREAGAEVSLWQVPELVPAEILEKSGAAVARAAFAHVPVAKPTQMPEADAIIFGAPPRFGNMAAQMRNFLAQTGGLWANGALAGKIGSAFTSTASQHGGHETTLVNFYFTLMHHGIIVVGTPYIEHRLLNMAEITGGTPNGATTLAGIDGSRLPSENELAIARFQGRHVAQITNALVAGRKQVG
jgi:NAD(P)H dehydrogenase (quinone)